MLGNIQPSDTSRFRLTPLSIIAGYVTFGSIWIIIMTLVLLHISHDIVSLIYLEGFEKGLFVTLTALPLYLLIKELQTKARQNLQQYSDLVDFLPIAIGSYVEHRLVYANAAGLQLLKKTSLQEILGTSLFDVLVTDDILATQERLNEVKRGNAVPFEERQLVLADGTTLFADVAGIPFSYRGKQASLLLALDVTKRKQLEDERIRMYEALEQRVQERTYELERRQRVGEGFSSILAKLNSSLSLDEILTYIITQAVQILGASGGAVYRLDDAHKMLTFQAGVGQPIVHTSIPVGQGVLSKAITQKQPLQSTNVTCATPQTTLAVPLVVKESVYGGLALYFLGVCEVSADSIEIAAVTSDQIALAIANTSLLTEIEEMSALAERNRLAHDLHDSVSQMLFSASLIAEVLPLIWEIDPTEGLGRLHELRQLTRGAMAEMRTLLYELRPATLEEVPLPELLRHLVEATMGQASIPIELVSTGQVELPAQARIDLYRIAQQALDNIFRHAKASHARVSLDMYRDYVELQIVDNGCGFDQAEVLPGHMGLKIMHERAEAINASLGVRSKIGEGTTITVHCKIEDCEVSSD